jgi:hypothetical protein
VFVRAHDAWVLQLEVIRDFTTGHGAREVRARRAVEFAQLVQRLDKERANVCER